MKLYHLNLYNLYPVNSGLRHPIPPFPRPSEGQLCVCANAPFFSLYIMVCWRDKWLVTNSGQNLTERDEKLGTSLHVSSFSSPNVCSNVEPHFLRTKCHDAFFLLHTYALPRFLHLLWQYANGEVARKGARTPSFG